MNKILIIGINGSPHKTGRTAKLLEVILSGATKVGAKTNIIHLVDKKIKPCFGCLSIGKKCIYPCRIKDDTQDIHKLLLKADGIVLASPTYWFSPSGLMKNFIDRLTCLEENGFMLKGKIGAALAVSTESGGEEVANLMISILNEMGLVIPPFAAPFFSQTKGSWFVRDLRLLGQNIVRLAVALKNNKLNLGYNYH